MAWNMPEKKGGGGGAVNIELTLYRSIKNE